MARLNRIFQLLFLIGLFGLAVLAGRSYASGQQDYDNVNVPNADAPRMDEITAYKQGWYDGWRNGYRSAMVDLSRKLKDYQALFDLVLDYKKLVFEGKIAPIEVSSEYERTSNGTSLEFTRKTTIRLISDNDMSFIDLVKDDLLQSEKRIDVTSGYWDYIFTNDLPKEDIGFLVFLAEQNGLHPKLFQNMLVFSISDREPEAERIKERLDSSYDIKTDVKYVAVKPSEMSEGEENPADNPDQLHDQILALAKHIRQEEEELDASGRPVKCETIPSGIGGLLYYLHKSSAQAARLEIPHLNKDLVKSDIEGISAEVKKFESGEPNATQLGRGEAQK